MSILLIYLLKLSMKINYCIEENFKDYFDLAIQYWMYAKSHGKEIEYKKSILFLGRCPPRHSMALCALETHPAPSEVPDGGHPAPFDATSNPHAFSITKLVVPSIVS